MRNDTLLVLGGLGIAALLLSRKGSTPAGQAGQAGDVSVGISLPSGTPEPDTSQLSLLDSILGERNVVFEGIARRLETIIPEIPNPDLANDGAETSDEEITIIPKIPNLVETIIPEIPNLVETIIPEIPNLVETIIPEIPNPDLATDRAETSDEGDVPVTDFFTDDFLNNFGLGSGQGGGVPNPNEWYDRALNTVDLPDLPFPFDLSLPTGSQYTEAASRGSGVFGRQFAGSLLTGEGILTNVPFGGRVVKAIGKGVSNLGTKTPALTKLITHGVTGEKVLVQTAAGVGKKVIPATVARVGARAIPVVGWGLLGVDLVADVVRLFGADVPEWLGLSSIVGAFTGENPLEAKFGGVVEGAVDPILDLQIQNTMAVTGWQGVPYTMPEQGDLNSPVFGYGGGGGRPFLSSD